MIGFKANKCKPPSSRGLGHWLFKPRTQIRLLLGVLNSLIIYERYMKKKMHALLASEDDLRKQVTEILNETETVFSKRVDLLTGRTRGYTPFDEGDHDIPSDDVTKPIVTNALNRLNYTFDMAVPEMDLQFTKESANTRAVADLIIEGNVVLKAVPVVALMALESRFRRILNILKMCPTLPTTVEWVPDEERGPGFYKSKEATKTTRSIKRRETVILHPATDKHPANVIREENLIPVGTFSDMFYDGRLTSHQQQVLLSRTENIIRGIREAIRVANDIEVEEQHVAAMLFNILKAPIK